MIALNHILVPVDLSDCSQAALAVALQCAERFGSVVHVLHVVTEPFHEPCESYAPAGAFIEDVNRRCAEAQEQVETLVAAGSSPQRCLVTTTPRDDIREAILDYARGHGIDLIVCGTHGRRGLEQLLLPSVAEGLVRSAPCPVLTVHHASKAAGASAAAAALGGRR